MATDLAAEFLKNQKAAEEKYKGKQLTLVDAVVERKDSDDLILVADPKKTSPITVRATGSSDAVDQKLFDAVKPGDRVTIKCQFASAIIWSLSFDKCRLVP